MMALMLPVVWVSNHIVTLGQQLGSKGPWGASDPTDPVSWTSATSKFSVGSFYVIPTP